MEIYCGNKRLEVYPVQPYVYAVVAKGRKEFYQSSWDAFNSGLYQNSAFPKLIKIPVVPMSDAEIEAESLAFELGHKRFYPTAEKLKDIKRTGLIPKILEIIAVLAWLVFVVLVLIDVFKSF